MDGLCSTCLGFDGISARDRLLPGAVIEMPPHAPMGADRTPMRDRNA